MKITCVSDLHGAKPDLDGGDILIVAGDLTAHDYTYQYLEFSKWLQKQDYRFKVVIAGNHDGEIQRCKRSWFEGLIPFATYLQDSGCEFEGLKFWGSPWTPNYYDWAFMLPRGAPLKEKWDMIPNDTDILITHGPPYGVLDEADDKEKCGCEELMKAVARIKPELHVFGHIHEGYGSKILWVSTEKETKFVNAAHMNINYRPVNKPITIEL